MPLLSAPFLPQELRKRHSISNIKVIPVLLFNLSPQIPSRLCSALLTAAEEAVFFPDVLLPDFFFALAPEEDLFAAVLPEETFFAPVLPAEAFFAPVLPAEVFFALVPATEAFLVPVLPAAVPVFLFPAAAPALLRLF